MLLEIDDFNTFNSQETHPHPSNGKLTELEFLSSVRIVLFLYLNFCILSCRLLGPSTAQDAMQFTSGQSFNQGLGVQNPARVLMLDAAAVSIFLFLCPSLLTRVKFFLLIFVYCLGPNRRQKRSFWKQ